MTFGDKMNALHGVQDDGVIHIQYNRGIMYVPTNNPHRGAGLVGIRTHVGVAAA